MSKEVRTGISRSGITPGQQMVASCSGAIVTSLFMTPLDVVKIRLQAQKQPFKRGTCFLYCNGLMDHICAICGNGNGTTTTTTTAAIGRRQWYSRPSHFRGTFDAFIKIARYEGITSLWSGLPPTMFMAVPATVVYFTLYDQLKYFMGYREGNPSTRYIPMIAGATARVFAATLISPLELVRTKMQSQQLSYREVGTAIRSSIKEGGVLSLMRGLGPTLLRDVPFSGIYWLGYEYFKALQMKQSHHTQVTFYQSFAAGALAGSIAAVITLPFDVIKTHRQIELGKSEVFQVRESTSTWKIAAKMYRQQGVSALFAGLVPRLIKVAPACAIMISSYEFGKAFFGAHNAKKAKDLEQAELDTHQRTS